MSLGPRPTGRPGSPCRSSNLKDPRGRAVIEATAKRIGWVRNAKGDGRRGRGFAYTRYKNVSTYAAVALDMEVDRETGSIKILNVVSAVDVGQIINPDGVIAQTEGGVVQGLSWALKESVKFDQRMITSLDWWVQARGPSGPHLQRWRMLSRTPPGRRVRDLPLTPARVKRSLI